MDIGRLKNNYRYYDDSYVIPEEITLSIKESPEFNIHIENGYFRDIFSNALMDGKGWKGFTRDYLERRGAWDEMSEIEDIDEYINDIMQYAEMKFDYEDTSDVLALVVDFLTYAKQTGQTVAVDVF